MTEALWTVGELLCATGGTLEGEVTMPITGTSIDSRTLRPGEIYVAIKGSVHDGHKFAAAALEAGASLAIVSRPDDEMRAKGALLVVRGDLLNAMEAMGRAARKRSKAKILAITGSVGKTGTKEMLRLALSKSAKTHASIKSYNNHWGVPLSLSNLPSWSEYGLFEVGMNHPGEITPLVDMIRPHIAIITTVEPVHLGQFGSVEDIADAKGEIFSGVEAGGAAILNRDNLHFERLATLARIAGIDNIISFGADTQSDVRLIKSALHANYSCVEADVMGERVTYKIGAPGRHLVQNSLAVLAASKLMGADLALAALSLGGVRAAQGRGARTVLALPSGGNVILIDEAYNANPASMRAALELLGNTPPCKSGRRIAVLGDMLELGEAAPKLHRELSAPIDEAAVDAVYACGPMMAHLWQELPQRRRATYADTAEGLADALLSGVRSGDVIMIKGSLGSKMIPLVDALKRRFSGAEAA